MSLSCSRIPHLARAIADKRQPQARSLIISTIQLHASKQAVVGARSFSSTWQRSDNGDTRVPGPRPGRGAALKPSPQSQSLSRPVLPPKTSRSEYDQPDLEPTSLKSKKVSNYLFAVSIFGAILGGYLFYIYTSIKIDTREYNTSPNKLPQDADVSDRWCDAKRNFDYEVEGQEKIMWMKAKRRRLIREAYGDVLEVSAGTGRNMDLYDTRPYSPTESARYGRSTRHMITSLTFNDQSPVMIERAQKKWALEQKRRREGDRFTGDVKFITGDAGLVDVIPRPAGGYDTIVQSMGVCSMAEPVKFLRHLGRLVRQPGEPVQNSSPEKLRKEEGEDGKGGRIFLLEHGRGYDTWNWLNGYLDDTAPMHADRYGCWYNKDIGKVLEHSGLVVERVKRYYFGTVWEVILRPAPKLLPE